MKLWSRIGGGLVAALKSAKFYDITLQSTNFPPLPYGDCDVQHGDYMQG